jgi:NAD+ kinase
VSEVIIYTRPNIDVNDPIYKYVIKKAQGKSGDFALSLGGDGTFLEAAEKLIDQKIPIYGINLGHVGFLCDGNPENYQNALDKLFDGQYQIVKRSTIDVKMIMPDGTVVKDWAINEAAIEKAGIAGERFGMLNARVEVDGQKISRYGCDGIVISTSTGSTAHAYSAGGPIIWPEVEAMIVVPIAAHALFSRPFIVGNSSYVKCYIDETQAHFATLICDGRRAHRLPAGSIVEITKGEKELHFAKVEGSPWANKFVQKFKLPVDGWR